jgi:CheY-like chemotaxis protein
MDGFMASRAIRAGGGPNAGTPIVALTADVLPSTIVACREVGITSHLAKPIEWLKLQELVGGLAPEAPAEVGRNMDEGLCRVSGG